MNVVGWSKLLSSDAGFGKVMGIILPKKKRKKKTMKIGGCLEVESMVRISLCFFS